MRTRIALVAAAATLMALAAPTGAATSHTVTVGDDFFRPTTLTVNRGTVVTWRWRGQNPHNVTVTSGPARFHSPTKTSGTFSRNLSRAGTYRLICTIHHFRMKLVVR